MQKLQFALLLIVVSAIPMIAQKPTTPAFQAFQKNQPANLNAPVQVGRFTRGEFHDFGSKAAGVAYRYSTGDSTDVTVYLYEKDPKTRAIGAEAAIRDQVQLFTRALEVEKGQGMLGDYRIAFTEPDSVASGSHTIRGWQLGYVFRRGDRV
jgi:hypothetical protein